jgi:lipopolysaccharide/colanic/teichoic acid biosynthesis glycosyltransferase
VAIAARYDELPQLWDVLRGEMSLVGPRPEVPTYAALWTPAERETILSVRPGITDPASILFRHEADELALAAPIGTTELPCCRARRSSTART